MPMTTTLLIDFDLMIEACSLSCDASRGKIGVPSTIVGQFDGLFNFQDDQKRSTINHLTLKTDEFIGVFAELTTEC